MAIPSSFGDGNGDNMNAYLWGELQIFIDLSIIYAKLPLAPFFRLRQVCKEWNRLASDRQFLEQNFKPPIFSNPYFILTHPSEEHVLLTFEGSLWTSTPIPRTRCEMSGLLFEDSDRNRIFDLHTRVFHTLPPFPEAMQLPPYEDALTTMTVDTTQIPYGFKIIIADGIIGTRIYDSNCGFWTHKPSTPVYSLCKYDTSCIHYNKSLYIKVEDRFVKWLKYQIYNLERDEWTKQDNLNIWSWSCYSHIYIWQDRWFGFIYDHGLQLTVWECSSGFRDPYTLFDQIPNGFLKWVQESDNDPIKTKCYGEHVLFYNNIRGGNRAILYNLDRKTWDKIKLPTISMLQ